MNANKELIKTCLDVVAGFEGSSGGIINTTDGELLSYGSIHYALKSGGLYEFLRRIERANPNRFKAIMGDAFTKALKTTRPTFTQWVAEHVTPFKSLWQPKFTQLWDTHERREADAEMAQRYVDGAEKLCQLYGMRSQRAFMFFLDRSVQQGPTARPQVTSAIKKAQNTKKEEWEALKAAAHAYADTANPRWHDDVLSRALTCALGSTDTSGMLVHGRRINLNALGISPTAPLTSPPGSTPPQTKK